MSNYTRVSIAAAIVLFLVVFGAWCANNANAVERPIESPVGVYPLAVNGVDNVGLNDNGVIEILATERSTYIIDPRFNLCFYETRNPYGITAVKIPCEPFERVVSGLKK